MAGRSGKRIYILGAGFSYDAGCPLQAQILDRIQSFDVKNLIRTSPISFDVVGHFDRARSTLNKFLQAVFPKDIIPSLEDVFTLLDQTIETHGSCGGFGWRELEICRSALGQTILFTFHSASEAVESEMAKFYRSVAAYVIRERLRPGQSVDPLAIVSLNWDSVLEDAIYWCIDHLSAWKQIDIDYCCYTTPLEKTSPHTPSPLQKAAGLYNVKLMKLHGSANWLVCPNCDRLFTGVGARGTAWDLYVREKDCPECSKRLEYVKSAERSDSDGSRDNERSVYKESELLRPLGLQPFFVSPTYVKKFSNPHIQMTWHNAFLDLSETDEVVFVGYSLPEADYHIRTLLRRSVRQNARIEVVLAEADSPKKEGRNKRHSATAQRYISFFGLDRVSFDFSGVRGHFQPILGKQAIGAMLGTLKLMLQRRNRNT